MTDEVGVITGDLTISTTHDGDTHATIEIQYTGADEWYTLTGSPVRTAQDDLDALHERVVKAVRAGGAATATE